MGAKAFEVDTEHVLMASVLATMHIKYRFVFEALPGDKEATYAASVEAVSGCSTSGWIRLDSMPALIQWLNQASK